MTGWMPPAPHGWEDLVERALSEDIGGGDLTAHCLPPDRMVSGYIEAQAIGRLSGAGIAVAVLGRVANIELLTQDSVAVADGTRILSFKGPAATVLSHERVALNFLMLLSGVASLTAQFVEAVQGTDATIVDTRKTIPGMRTLQKYAVRCGGGRNHRMGLYDAVMIKDNHIRAAGSILEAISIARRSIPHTAKIEVEADLPEQAHLAVEGGADIVLLDNMAPSTMRAIVDQHKGRPVLFEASGGVNLRSVREIAESGVHLISVGALTHSAPALPFHMELDDA